MMKLRSKKGFSLVELIIVIAILGIIAVIAVPNLTSVQKNSQVNADIRTAEQIGKAVRIWLTDTNNVTEANAREDVISGKYVTLAEILTADSEFDDYISTTYTPNAKTGLAYYVTMDANYKIHVIIDDAKPTSIPATKYEIVSGAVQDGLAYKEGVSSL